MFGLLIGLWWAQWAGIGFGPAPDGPRDGSGPPARPALEWRPRLPISDTVRGFVYDSLLAEPLTGALVTAMPGGETTVSDSVGRFVLISAQPVELVQAVHAELDQIGLGEMRVARVQNAAARELVLATPSRRTIWQRLCGQVPPHDAMTGIVFGSVRDGDGRTLLGGVIVDLQWESLQMSADTMPRYETRTTRSDTSGQFLFCGVQEFGQAGIAARADARHSGNVLLYAEVRPVRRVDLVLGAINAPAVLVRGTVQDPQGAPVYDATVEIDGGEQPARTDSAGGFTVVRVPPGSRMMTVRKVGLLPTLRTVDVVETMAPVTITMERGISLDGVTVTARRTVSRTLRDLMERRRAGIAGFLDSTRIMQFPRTQSVLRMIPSLTVHTAANGVDFTLRGRLNCGASVYIDGVKVSTEDLAVLPMEDIATIESYGTDTFAPPQYRSFVEKPCAVILVWTKPRLKRP